MSAEVLDDDLDLLANGRRVSASGSFDVDALCRVVRVLGG